MKDGGPAFACCCDAGGQVGMTLRDYFAASALDAIVAYTDDDGNPLGYVEAAENAYDYAAAMLLVRENVAQ